jgi:hypothetical protein
MIEYKVRVYADGAKHWFLNNQRHREDGPAIERANGGKSWYLNGKRHREDGPAIEGADGTKSWYLNGELHREDGPAVEWASGTKHWHLKGKKISEQEFLSRSIKEMTLSQVIEKLGYDIKIVKE